MQYKKRYTFSRIDQDLAPDKRDSSTHMNIVNMEIFLTSRGASLQAAQGTEEIPDPESVLYPNVTVIGHSTIEDDLYIFTTDNTGTPNSSSSDAIIKVIVTDTVLTLELIQAANWGFSSLYPIDAIGISESASSEKLYWIDAYNQARFINVLNPNANVDYVLSNPTPAIITAMPYGVTASRDAVARYGYTQYNISGSESKLSPLTNTVSLSTEGDSAKVVLSGLSSVYDTYRVYRVMWDSYNDAPTYAVISEGEVGDNANITIIDGGNLLINNISVEEFVDIGSDLMVPGTLEAKKQRLFLGNYKVEPFEVSEDIRAFSYATGSQSLDTPEAIPADLNLVYQPYTTGGVPVSGELAEYVVGTPVWGVLKEWNTQEFTINTPTFYIQAGPLSHNILLKLYDIASPTNHIGSINLYGGHDLGYTRNVAYTSGIASGYRVVMQRLDYSTSDEYLSLEWSSDVETEVEFTISHNTVPDKDGWVYSGVDGVVDTTGIKLSPVALDGELSPSYYYDGVAGTTITAVDQAFNTVLTLRFVGRLYFSGVRIHPHNPVWAYLEADLTGDRQQLIGSGGSIKLREASETPGDGTVYSGYSNVPTDIDAINTDPSTYKYQSDGVTLGVEGAIVKLKLTLIDGGPNYVKERKFKQGETYRIAAVFFDNYGRSTAALWVCDLLIPYVADGNSVSGERDFYRLTGTVKSWPTGARSFKFVYVKRTLVDKTILFQGVPQPVMSYTKGGDNVGLYPFPTTKEVKGNGASGTGQGHFDVRVPFNPYTSEDFPIATDFTCTIHDQKINFVYTPEVFLYNTKLPANRVRLVGLQEILPTLDKTRMEHYNPGSNEEWQQTFDSMKFDIRNDLGENENAPRCLLGDFTDADAGGDAYSIWMYYRGTGKFHACTPKEEVVGECKYLAIDSVSTVDSYVISNTIDQPNFAKFDGDNDPCNYQAEHADCFVIKTDSTTWAGTPNYADFLAGTSMGGSITDRAFPIVDIMQTLNEQYGGNTLEAKTRNTYIDASEGSASLNVETTLYGDIYNAVYYLPKTTSTRKVTNGHDASVFDTIKVALESEVNVNAANKIVRDINGTFDGAISGNLKTLEVKNLLTYDTIYSQLPTTPLSIAKPFNYVQITEYQTRITTSNAKISGELIDNWTKINLGTYMDLESPYGSITKLVRSKDNMFAFQNRGIAYISIFPEKQTSTPTGNISLGKGTVLDNYQYISIDSGTENKQCIAVNDKEVFYIDTVKKTLNNISEGEVSTLKGFNSVIRQYATDGIREYLVNNPEGGFVVINNNLKQVLFKFADAEVFPVLVYNYASKVFTNSRTYDGYYFLSFNNRVLSAKDSLIYRHDTGEIGKYYGSSQSANIQMYTEPLPGVDKVFDAVAVLKQGDDNFDYITVESPTRTSGRVPTEFKDKFDMHTSHLPRVEGTMERFRERNLKIWLEYTGLTSLEVDEIFLKFSIKK